MSATAPVRLWSPDLKEKLQQRLVKRGFPVADAEEGAKQWSDGMHDLEEAADICSLIGRVRLLSPNVETRPGGNG